jgi:cell division control protein 45
MGLSLEECKSKYSFMSEQNKRNLVDRIGPAAAKLQISNLHFPSFMRQYDTTTQISAADVAFALTALLEKCKPQNQDEKENEDDNVWEENFHFAYGALSSRTFTKLRHGLDESIRLAEAIVEEGVSIIKQRKYTSFGGLFRSVMIEDSNHLDLLSQPMASSKLALFLVDALKETGRRTTKPFVICSKIKAKKTYLVVGVTGRGSRPTAGRTINTFGLAFRNAAERVQARVKHDGFETSVLQVQEDDLRRFIEFLHSGLIEL